MTEPQSAVPSTVLGIDNLYLNYQWGPCTLHTTFKVLEYSNRAVGTYFQNKFYPAKKSAVSGGSWNSLKALLKV